MPGIFAVIDTEKNSDLGQLISKMADAITHESWHKGNCHVDQVAAVGLGRVSTGILNPRPQPVFNREKNIAIIMEGEVFDSSPEIVLRLYEDYGESFVTKLNGFFALVIWDKAKEKVIIANDRFGFRPLYYARRNGRLLLCSEVKGILADPKVRRDIDKAGVADFFTFGHLLGDKTLIKDVCLIPPGSIWVYKGGQLAKKQYWKLDQQFGVYQGSEEDYLEEFNDLLKKSVSRQLVGDHDLTVSLTGGLDSRAVFALIDHESNPVRSFTHGIKGCADLMIAERVGKGINGHKHVSYELDGLFLERFSDHAERTVFLTDGMGKLGQAQVLFSRAQERQHAQIELNASGADLSRGWGLKPLILASKSNNELIDSCLACYKVNFEPDKLFSSIFYSEIADNPRSSLQLLFSNLNNDLPVHDKANYFYVLEHIRRLVINGWALAGNHIELRLPYWDNDLIPLLLKAPLSLLDRGRAIPKYVIKKNNPALAAMPVVDGNYVTAFQENKRDRRMRRLKDIFDSYSSRYLYPFLPAKTPKRGFARPYLNYAEWMRKQLKDFTRSVLLDPRTLGRGYYDPDHVKKMISEHVSRKKDNSNILNLMIGFELWNRQFIDQRCKEAGSTC